MTCHCYCKAFKHIQQTIRMENYMIIVFLVSESINEWNNQGILFSGLY